MDATLKNLELSKLWHYSGQLDKNNIRFGFGKEIWKNDEMQQYDGYIQLNCLHGIGKYTWDSFDCYEGSFYANNVHGYGCMSYANGSYFEGLFKENQRYGPGIFTYPDGTQDVGLWIENQLIRLSTNLTEKTVPNLTKSPDAKIYLNKYKKLIIIQTGKTPSQLICEQLNALDLKKFEKYLYNDLVKNTSSLFFNKSKFDKHTSRNDVSKFSVSSDPFQNKTTEILAWNNEEHLISLMEYIYENRSSEMNVSFKVLELLNEREIYGPTGKYEISCEKLFDSVANKRKITSKLITESNLNPDICDVLGNTAVHCAVSTDNIQDLRVLLDLGANLDQYNDECLTPLLICLLRYLEVKENITNWEVAFLPPISVPENEEQKYLLDLSCKVVKLLDKQKKEKKSKGDKIKEKTVKEKKKRVSSIIDFENIINEELLEKEERLARLTNTFEILLNYGADPNLGEVPLPPLLLSLFTHDLKIVNGLISHGANCNLSNSHEDGFLSPLHIVASMKPCEELPKLAQILLENNAPLNPRANGNHWLDEKDLLDPSEECVDEGKTPLHVLAMRYDFVEDESDFLGDLYDKMIQYGCNPDLQYLGHTCLSMAVLRGNLKLINHILQKGNVNSNQQLGCDLGVPLTVLILKKYKNALPLYVCQKVYDLLLLYKANPFYSSIEGKNLNCIEFCDEENRPESGKKTKANKKDPHGKVIQIFYKCAQSILDRHIMAKAIKHLYTFKILCDFLHPIFNQLVKFLDVPETQRILQIFANHEHIYINVNGIKSLLTFVKLATSAITSAKSKRNSRGKEKSFDHLEQFAKDLCKEPLTSNKIEIPEPEIDEEEEKYQVCYNCFKKEGKVLVLCPTCELVYFCSLDCNKNNLKKKTRHGCKNLFYVEELKMIKEGIFRPLILEELENRKSYIYGNFSRLSLNFSLYSSRKSDEKSNMKKTKHASMILNKKNETRKPKTI